jgi:hypothetical protein
MGKDARDQDARMSDAGLDPDLTVPPPPFFELLLHKPAMQTL